MKRGIKQKPKSPQKPKPSPPKPPTYRVNWKDKALEDMSPQHHALLPRFDRSPSKSDLFASIQSYSLSILSHFSKESDLLSDQVCQQLQNLLFKELLEIEVNRQVAKTAEAPQKFKQKSEQESTKPTLKTHLINSQLLQVSYDIDAKVEEQIAFSFGNKQSQPYQTNNILLQNQEQTGLSSLKRSPKEHKGSESSLNTDALSRSHKPDRLISPKNPEQKLQRLLPQLSPYSNIGIRKSKTEIKHTVKHLEAKITNRPSSNRAPSRVLHTTKLPLEKQLSFKSKRVPLTLVDLLVEENQSRLSENQEEQIQKMRPARAHHLLRSLGRDDLRMSDQRRHPYESRNRFNIGGPLTQGSQGAQASQRTNSIQRNRRLSQREVRSEQKFEIQHSKQHISTRTNYQKNSSKLRKQLNRNRSTQKHTVLSQDSCAYANMTEPERSRNRGTPQSELSKETYRGDTSPRIDSWNRVDIKKSDRALASPIRYKSKETSYLSYKREDIHKSETLRINSKYARYGKLDRFID